MRTLLVIGKVWPEPTASAAGSRILQLIGAFKSGGWQVTLACAAKRPEHHFSLSEIGVHEVEVELNDSSFNTYLEDLGPDAVMFDRFMTEEQFGWRVAQVCPDALKILDTEDLHCLRSARKSALGENRSMVSNDLLIEESAKRELASIYRCDLSLIISEVELEYLQTVFKVDEHLIHYVPFLTDPITDLEMASWPSFVERKHFVTIGNFLHEPNWDSIQYLKSEIWPLIRSKLPMAELHVFGSYATEKNHTLNNPKSGFLVKGFADNSSDILSKAKVCLAPLRFGAGLKGKLLEAMQCGTPSVTTSIGAEAMNGEFNWPGCIEDDSTQFAKEAVNLYTDEEAWNTMQSNGTKIVNVRFLRQEHQSKLLNRINDLFKQLESHRNANFIGSMMKYHLLRSTEFMSRWIEAKNSGN